MRDNENTKKMVLREEGSCESAMVVKKLKNMLWDLAGNIFNQSPEGCNQLTGTNKSDGGNHKPTHKQPVQIVHFNDGKNIILMRELFDGFIVVIWKLL